MGAKLYDFMRLKCAETTKNVLKQQNKMFQTTKMCESDNNRLLMGVRLMDICNIFIYFVHQSSAWNE